jgi:hypothetical protein
MNRGTQMVPSKNNSGKMVSRQPAAMKVTHISNIRDAARMVLNRHVRVISDYDLRTPLTDKADDAEEFDGWSVFLNKRGKLAHALRKGCPWMMIRIVGINLKGTSADFRNKVISEKLYEGLS